MFMDKVVSRIWEPVTCEYKRAYYEALEKSDQELFDAHVSMTMKHFPYTGVTMNYVETTGCPYRMAGEVLSGCSMCDYQSEFASRQGSLLALRKKNPKLYAKAISASFRNCRGSNVSANIIENVSGYDSLDYNEVPPELCHELFENNLFDDSPFIYNVEARASSVTRARLHEFKQTVRGKKRVSIDFGVEVGNEWLRNEWLNKSISDQNIVNAVSLCHEYGFKAVGNVLLGLPGLTEDQSIDFFVDSVKWMYDKGIDKIVIHVLNRKQYTLHGFLYHSLRDDAQLNDVGLVYGEHTGVPWLFTVVRALTRIQREIPEAFSKTVMVRLDEKFNSIQNTIAYNSLENKENDQKWITYLNALAFSKDYDSLLGMEKELVSDPCWEEYLKLLNKQKKAGNPSDTIALLAKKIAQRIFGKEWEEYYHELNIPASLGVLR